MKVILRSDIERLGKIGSVVNVAPGYARNFLIPKLLAYPANEGNLKRIEFEKRRAAQLAEHEVQEARKQADKLKDLSLTFQVKVGEEDQLYGSVAINDIADEAAKQGFEIDRRKIVLEEPIKQLGVYTVNVRLHPEVTAEIKVWVVKE
ncbi:MAG: 50S ribosomal protein L9 [Candidatus Glassbacteria bacterium RIFCSPLOWO2_12_FULL_58_11]|uniref:Large ribosomal subunit protein bL9 n=2 Tax=Candidatus Glassiibacteriota TaxID=1817805 RepID=A0A1F5Z0F4_9BACT|nr:MAG: 50S ribosomal protein L9 [Candidatus Glassbacteria bacterium GWA2_58_10]OGG05939.1 MAG: 50S ribosomal protein L9 [Candidatus Glassbacteria bacterium RIFCSPLOWO2_12_FULL_58_11]